MSQVLFVLTIKCNYRKIVKIAKRIDKNGNIVEFIAHKKNEIVEEKEIIRNKNKKLKENSEVLKIIKEKYYNNHNKDTINQNKSYNDCNTLNTYLNHNFIDCNIHIVDKTETSFIEAKNSSLRGKFARFIRKTKAYSKNFENMEDTMLMLVYRGFLIDNRVKYCSYYGKCDCQENIRQCLFF